MPVAIRFDSMRKPGEFGISDDLVPAPEIKGRLLGRRASLDRE